jgi:hypothetical protein
MKELSDPIVIFEDDYEGDYMVLPKKHFEPNLSTARKVIWTIGIIALVILIVAISCRVARRLLN